MKRPLPRIGLLGCLLGVFMLCAPFTIIGAKEQLHNVRRYVPDAPVQQPEGDEWTFSADRVVGDMTSEYVEAYGNVSFALGDDQLRADFARYYQSTGWVFLKGDIRAHWGGDFLQADEAEFDLNTMTGWLKNGKLFMAKPHIYVEAERVGKAKGDTYTFKNARVTACDGDQPAWSVTTEEGDVQLDGRVRLYRSAFRIKDVPVFYWPYMSLPGRMERQTGFLPPYVASSDKLGFRLVQPYYWVVSDEVDATFYQNYMSRRGYMQGVEVRHANDSETRGVWNVDLLKDNRRAATAADEWEDYQNDDLLRPNRSRWWVRGKFDGWLGSPLVKVKVDLDVVSDQNFLRDFQDGPSGFDAARETFLDTFGRDIDNKDDTTRTSVALVTRSWDRFGAAGKLAYTQDLQFFNGNGDDSDDTTVQVLPELEGFAFQQSIAGTPIEVSAEAKYDFFYRNLGHSGHRVRLTPEIKLPLKTDYVTFIPSASIDQTFYDLTTFEGFGNQTIVDSGGRDEIIDTNATEDGFQSRTAWTAGFTAFSELTRTFALAEDMRPEPTLAGSSRWTRLKHSIVPRVSYSYSPTITGQDRYPYFDSFDRVEGQNLVTYSVTNVLDRRRDSVVLTPGDDGGPRASVRSDFLDFFLFRLQQSYDRNEATRTDQLARYERRPFSDVLAEFRVKPEVYVDLSSRTWFSPYLGKVTQNENTVRFFRDGLGEITIGYDFLTEIDEYTRLREEELNIISLGAAWEIDDAFTLRAKYRHDLNNRFLERTLGLDWAAQCYTLQFTFTQKPNDTRFQVGFDLFNF